MLEERDIYNKQKVYEEKIEPIINQLKLACNMEHLPMFVTVAVENNEKETVYRNDMIYASTDIRLSDRKIGNLLLLVNDFQTEPPLHIQSCIRDLQDYLDRMKVAEKKAASADITLSENKLQDMNAIMNGGDRTGLPRELVEKVLSEESYKGL